VAIRKAKPFTFRPRGLTDDPDGSSSFPGAMAILQNIVPSPTAKSQFVPRTASIQLSNFGGFTTPTKGSAMLVVGDFIWGMIASARNAGKDEPFCYDIVNAAFIAIGNVTAANCPTSPATSGDWEPPTIAMITSGRIVITHPGYDGITYFLGWIDLSSFVSNTITGSTHTSTLIDTLSSNPITAGWQVGHRITGAGIPANTFITALTAASVTLSQATSATAAGVALTVAGGTPAAPLYGAGNVNGAPLVARPKAVAQFNSRAWYAVGNTVVYSDTLSPTQVTAASQALTVGDSAAVTALSGLPLTSQVAGGTLQALIAFKGAGPYTQITGDAATSNLAKNEVAGSVGTLGPNTICTTPDGIAYISPDGLRVITLAGTTTPVIGDGGEGVALPFISVDHPSRMCAAFNEQTFRVSVQNLAANGDPTQEYWFDIKDKTWSGPHTFPADLIEAYHGTTAFPFIHFANGINGKLWSSSTKLLPTASYTENGVALSFVFQSALLPDNEEMAMNAVVETTLAYEAPSTQMMTVLAEDELGNVLDTVYLNGSSTGTLWDSFNWGAGTWGSGVDPFRQHAVNWNVPLVFKQASLRITGFCLANFVLAETRLKYQTLGYKLQ
jgi:hypothetical protein